jgi:protein O-GlcNAc transferase
LSSVDYRFTCPISDPPGTTEHLHTEQLIRLPHFICYQPPSDSPGVGPLPAHANGWVTFACFNNIPKVTDAAIRAWAEILRAVPESRLLLKSRGYGSNWVRERIIALFAECGVDPQRVKMIEFVPTKNEHLALYNSADIGLDTWPYNGTVTTCEALWMGVPVVTLAGHVHAARVGLSLAVAAGHESLAVSSVTEYVAVAAELAHDLVRLNHLRANMRSGLASSPLMDYHGLAHNMETAYRRMLDQASGTRNSQA